MNKKIKILSSVMCGLLLGSNLALTTVQAKSIKNAPNGSITTTKNDSKVYVEGNVESGYFTEKAYLNDKTIVFNHSLDEEGNKVIEVIEDEGRSIVKYDKSENAIYVNGKRLSTVSEKTVNEKANIDANMNLNDYTATYSNSWTFTGTDREKWFVEGLTVGVIAAALAGFAEGPVGAFLNVASFLSGACLWMSAEKDKYVCYNYNGTYKVGWYNYVRVYSDNEWTNQVYSYKTAEQSR